MALWRSGVILNLNVPFLSKTQYFRFRLPSYTVYWPGRIHILNRHGGSNLQDDYSVYIASPN
jgi:hypothetical protein